jgi:C_GCAxxG_C_C family probable redox protein
VCPFQEDIVTDHSKDERARRARDLFLSDPDNNCAQSIIRVYADLDEAAEAAVTPLGWALGGGLASEGHICGTLLGAVMVLGAKLRYEFNLPSSDASVLVREFIQEFQAKNGSLLCRDIVGELEPERFESICRPMVYDTCLLMEEFLALFDEEHKGDE